MKTWNDKIATVYGTLYEALDSIAVFKELKPRFNEGFFQPDIRSFWRIVSDNCLQMAAIQWCKIFGSEGNELYWKQFVDEQLFYELVSFERYVSVADAMRAFRNKYVAHNGGYKDPVPYFDEAVWVICAFDKIVREEYEDAEDRIKTGTEYYFMKQNVKEYLNQLQIQDI